MRMRRLYLFSLMGVLVFFVGCVTYKNTHAYKEDLAGLKRVLPKGSYQKSLDVIVSSKKAMRLLLDTKHSRSGIVMKGRLYGEQRAAFEIIEGPRGSPKLTIFDEKLEKNRPVFEKVYRRLRPLFMVGSDAGKNKTQFKKYDENGIPRVIKMSYKGLKMHLSLDAYDIL